MGRALVGNAADKRQVRKAKKQEEQEERLSRIELGLLLKQREFRHFLWRLLDRANAFKNAFVPDSNITQFNLGQQSVAQDILGRVAQADPEAWIKMQMEHKEKAETEDEQPGQGKAKTEEDTEPEQEGA